MAGTPFYPKQILTAADLNAAVAAAPENITVPMAAADVKLVPVTGDMVPIMDSAAGGALKRVSVDALKNASAPDAGVIPFSLAASYPGGSIGEYTQTVLQAINNIATLRGIAPTVRSVWLKGYSTSGDGGGGEFRGVTGAAAGTYVDDGGYVIVPTGGDGSSAWVRVNSHLPVSVAEFGAFPANADNATQFLAAVTKARAIGKRVYLPYGTYNLSSVPLPENNVYFVGERINNQGPTLQALSTTGDMLSIATPAQQTHSICFENVHFNAAVGTTTARALYINTATYIPFNINFKHCRVDGFDVGVHAEKAFWSIMEHMSVWNCLTAGVYGFYGPNNTFISCEVGTVPTGAAGYWLLCREGVIIDAASASNFSGSGSLYRIGTDTTMPAPYNKDLQGYVDFIGGHFEVGAPSAGAIFVEVRNSSRASGRGCDFLVQGTGAAVAARAAVLYSYLTAKCEWLNCHYAGAAGGTFTNHIEVTSATAAGQIVATPDTKNGTLTYTGVTTGAGSIHLPVLSVVNANHNAAQTITAGATTTLSFNTAPVNTLSEWVTNTFTTINSGLYRVSANLTLGGTNTPVAGQRYRLSVLVGGVMKGFTDFVAVNTLNQSVSLNTVLPLLAGESVTFQLNNTSAASVDVAANWSHIDISKIN